MDLKCLPDRITGETIPDGDFHMYIQQLDSLEFGKRTGKLTSVMKFEVVLEIGCEGSD